MSTILVTNVLAYAGPGAVSALLAHGHHVVCHDPAFADEARRQAFVAANPGATSLTSTRPDDLVAEVIAAHGAIDGLVSNDVHPNTPRAIEDIPLDELRATFEAVLVVPFRLAQLVLAHMKPQRRGSMVFVTSARTLRPEAGFAVATTIRAGTTAFASALARESAPFGIQVNAVAPNYLASELYYPRARFVEDRAGREAIAAVVPAGRLGEPEEIGELIAFLVSGKSRFTTGQTIYFTGGWP